MPLLDVCLQVSAHTGANFAQGTGCTALGALVDIEHMLGVLLVILEYSSTVSVSHQFSADVDFAEMEPKHPVRGGAKRTKLTCVGILVSLLNVLLVFLHM